MRVFLCPWTVGTALLLATSGAAICALALMLAAELTERVPVVDVAKTLLL
jgi:hypothetical protein